MHTSSKNVLLIYGGGGTEHDISVISSKHIKNTLSDVPGINLISVEITKDGKWICENGKSCQLDFKKLLQFEDETNEKIDYAIPCLHGFPGETGDIQSFFEMIKLPYMGCNAEASRICFNKLTTKLWFDALKIPNTPFIFLTEDKMDKDVEQFLSKHQKVVVKAASQGSSVGCYLATNIEELKENISKAFNYSEFVVIEKFLKARELEISTYTIENTLHITAPGEISCPSKFYTYEEKYSQKSETKTSTRAENLSDEQINQMKIYAHRAFISLKLQHLSRMDFFLTDDGEILLNEINTFPGLTPISMFPKMMEANGHSFKDFLVKNIR